VLCEGRDTTREGLETETNPDTSPTSTNGRCAKTGASGAGGEVDPDPNTWTPEQLATDQGSPTARPTLAGLYRRPSDHRLALRCDQGPVPDGITTNPHIRQHRCLDCYYPVRPEDVGEQSKCERPKMLRDGLGVVRAASVPAELRVDLADILAARQGDLSPDFDTMRVAERQSKDPDLFGALDMYACSAEGCHVNTRLRSLMNEPLCFACGIRLGLARQRTGAEALASIGSKMLERTMAPLAVEARKRSYGERSAPGYVPLERRSGVSRDFAVTPRADEQKNGTKVGSLKASHDSPRALRVLGIVAMVEALSRDPDLWGYARYFVATWARLFRVFLDSPDMLRTVYESKVLGRTGEAGQAVAESPAGNGAGAVHLVQRAAWALALATTGELYESSEVFPLPCDVRFASRRLSDGEDGWAKVGPARMLALDSLDLWSDVGLAARQWAGWKLATLHVANQFAPGEPLTLDNIFDADEGDAWWKAARLVTLAKDAGLSPAAFAEQLSTGGAL
jgi:hypothetical protein